MLSLKNWLIEGLSYSLPVILEKQKLNLKFWGESKQSLSKEKQSLLLKIVKFGVNKLADDCTPQKISQFA